MVIPKYILWKHSLNICEYLSVRNVFFIFGDITTFLESRCAIGILIFWCDFCPVDVTFFQLAVTWGWCDFFQLVLTLPSGNSDIPLFAIHPCLPSWFRISPISPWHCSWQSFASDVFVLVGLRVMEGHWIYEHDITRHFGIPQSDPYGRRSFIWVIPDKFLTKWSH